MSFIKSIKEIRESAAETSDFYDAEMLAVIYETKEEIVERLLPKPLKPIERPLVMTFIGKYPKTNFGISYDESALFLLCEFKGEQGAYCLSMPVNNDMAMVGGREIYGYPKKMANIHFERKKDKFLGWVERYGIRFVEIEATISREATEKEVPELIWSGYKTTWNVFNFKHFPNPQGTGFDYWPRLIKEKVTFDRKSIELGEATIKFQSLKTDPWQEVEVVKILETIYTVGDNYMLKGKVVARINPLKFAPYAFLKWD